MQHTTNYNLNQWDADDRVTREDFNADNAAIDAALAACGKGNCRLETWTYTGTGSYGTNSPTRLAFSAKPDLFIVKSKGQGSVILLVGSKHDTENILSISYISQNSIAIADLKWSGAEAQIISTGSAAQQANQSGKQYQVFAFHLTA